MAYSTFSGILNLFLKIQKLEAVDLRNPQSGTVVGFTSCLIS